MDNRPYQVCTVCIMDTTDLDITFDESGQCHHCRQVRANRGVTWFPDGDGQELLEKHLKRIREEGRRSRYDSIIGVSGGVDSSYLLLKAHEWGLRPLVFHVDAGWNSELAVQNIERLVKFTGYELHTQVVNWETMRQLQLSYLRAGVANQDTPQDHAFFANLYGFANKNRLRTVLNGGNVATEGIFPTSWQWSNMDLRSLKAIHRRFGDGEFEGYSTVGLFAYYVWLPHVRRVRPIRPLNWLPYSKDQAIETLSSTVGWRPYPRKHGESLFTKFYQGYYLPVRFGFDMRRPHLSSLIASGSMTRGEALALLEEPLYDDRELERDIQYLCKKLRIEREEFSRMMSEPVRHPREFPNWESRYLLLKKVQSRLGALTGRRLTIYS